MGETSLVSAQTSLNTILPSQSKVEDGGNNPLIKRNIVKINLTNIALKNYSVEYERVLNKTISVCLNVRMMPENSLPLKSLFLKLVGDDEFDRNAVENFRLSNYALTPEFRFYLSRKGYGRGLYVAPFYRYATFSIKDLPAEFSSSSGTMISINHVGNFSSHTGGLLFGAQWEFGKRFNIDWSIVGAHYGSGSGELIGLYDRNLTPYEQNELREMLENATIPLTVKTVYVNDKGTKLKLNGAWGGLRTGLSIGLRF